MQEKEIYLTEEKRNILKQFAKNGNHNAHLVTRARVILRLDRTGKKDHLRIGRISEELNLSRQAIYNIRNDYLNSKDIEDFLTRKKRETPPVPAKVTGEVEAQTQGDGSSVFLTANNCFVTYPVKHQKRRHCALITVSCCSRFAALFFSTRFQKIRPHLLKNPSVVL